MTDSGDLANKASHYLNALKVKWMQLQKTPTIFAYVLNIQVHKFLDGKHNFYVELNPERHSLRRRPEVIPSLKPVFAPKKFNFNKVNPLEVMLTIPYDGAETQMIVNRSPLTPFHTLICPQVESNLVQRLTIYSLRFAVNFLRYAKDPDCRMGYNSPGALASVNHLHFHLVHLPKNVYVDGVQIEKLAHDYAYRLHESMPTEAICFIVAKDDNDAALNAKLEQIYKLTEWLCDKNIPHNLFITHDRQGGEHKDAMKIFLFARDTYCENKELGSFNLGFCEQAGYITVGEKRVMDELNETGVIERIRDDTGDAYAGIYDYVQNKMT